MALTDGLIAKYDLDTNANDSVGSNNGTLQGDAAFATDGDRTVLTLDGSGDYVTLPDSDDWDFWQEKSFTVACWVKFDSIASTAKLFGHGSDGDNRFSLMWSSSAQSLTAHFEVATASESLYGASWTPTAGQWHHITYLKSGTSFAFYVDGTQMGSATLNKSGTLSGDFTIGGGLNGSGAIGNFLDGSIDDTRIWNRALSASEVTELHAESLALGLIASSMEEGGTLTGAAQLVSDGDRAQVLSLVGNSTSDYVQHASPYNHNNITISAWVKPSSTITGNAYIAGTEAGGGANNGYTLSTVGMQVGNWAGNAGSWSGFNAGSNLVVGEWAHLVNVIADGQQAMYINGALVHSQAMTIANPVSTVNFRIGNYPLATPSRPFPGQIDDVRLWNRALSASEVATLHSTTAATSDALVKHLKFDGNDTGMTLSGGAALATVDGRTTLALDGTGDYLTLPGSSDFDFGTADFTLGFWMKPTNTTQWAALMSSPNYWTSGYSGNWGIDIYNYPGIGSKIRLYSYGDGQAPASELAYVSSVVLTTEWQHIVFVRDSGTLKCFINGVESGSTRADNFSTADLSDGVNGLYLGHTAPGSGTDFDGSIDDVRIYSKALTTSEIASIMIDYDGYVAPDTTAPVITVLGTNPASVNAGATYTDAGATALDNIDGAVSVVTTGVSAINVAADANWNDVTLLLPLDSDLTDASTSGHTVTTTGSGVSISTAQKKFGAGSVHFDGSEGKLSAGTTTAATFGTDDFTIEMWAHWTDLSTANHPTFFDSGCFSDSGIAMTRPANVANAIQVGVPGWGAAHTFSFSPSTGQWYHLALVRNSGVLALYIDGTSAGTFNYAHNITGNGQLLIGGSRHSGSQSLRNTYLDGFRITKGVARYTANFSVPTEAYPTAATGGSQLKQLDANFSDVTVLLSEGTTDSSSSPITVTTVGAVSESTSTYKFGSKSIHINGANGYINLGNRSEWNLSNDFTMEMWAKNNGSLNHQVHLVVHGDDSSGWYFVIKPDGVFRFWTGLIPDSAPTNFLNGDWHHIALTRSGNDWKLFLDGVIISSDTRGDFSSYNGDLIVGTWPFSGYDGTLLGYIDDFRFTDGVARYTANFAVPTAAHPLATTMQNPSAYTVTYTATDAASNVATATRTVNVEADTTAPVITVVGDNPAAVTTGATYTDAGATAVDNIDGAVAVVTTGLSAVSTAGATNWEDVALQLPLDTDFTDTSTSTHTVTPTGGGVSISTAQKKFGAASALFNASGTSKLSAGSTSAVAFGTGDFTIEMWAYWTNTDHSTYPTFFDSGAFAGNGLAARRHAGNPNEIQIGWNNWSSGTGHAQFSFTPTTGQWYHLAFVRSGGTFTVYANGTSLGSMALTYNFTAGELLIGASRHSGTEGMKNGHLDDFRITKGVARYTSNFSVPTEAHPTSNSAGGAITGTHTVTYTATDAANNVATATRVVNVEADTTAPVITVVGDNPAAVTTGATYTDAGATAVDNIDGAVAVVTTGVSAISAPGATNWEDVVLQLPLDTNTSDTSTAGMSITNNGATISASDPKFGAGSMSLNNDYLVVSPNSNWDLNFAADDFTVEMWYKTTTTPGNWASLISTHINTNGWGFYAIPAGGQVGFRFGDSTTQGDLVGTPGIGDLKTDGVWHHIAATKSGNIARIFQDGVEIATRTYAAGRQVNRGHGSCYIGYNRNSPGSQYAFYGSLDDIRITRGVARYTSGFTLPTEAHPTANSVGGAITGTHTVTYTATDAASNVATATRTVNVVADTTAPVITVVGDNPAAVVTGTTYTDAGATAVDNIDGAVAVVTTGTDTINSVGTTNWEDVVLQLPLDADFSDTSTSTHTVTPAGSTAITTSEKKFGAGSANLSTSGYVTVAGSSDFNLGTGDFTIECWAKTSYVQPGNNAMYLIDMRPNSTTIMGMYQNRSYAHVNGVALPYNGNAIGSNFNDGAWHHFALVRSGTTVTQYIDGFAIGSVTDSANVGGNSAWNIGARVSNNETWQGHLDDFRITKGVARYTSNFSVPTEAHPTSNSAGGAITGTHTVTYTATDAASNVATATRTVVVAVPDTTNPVITVTGDATLTVENGSGVYTDAGATATDDTDGNITANVVVSGQVVNTNIDGVYTIRYNVSDAAGNAATEATRVVTVTTSTNYATLVEGLNKYNSASHTNVVGTGVPTGEIGISPSGTGISLSLNAALLASGVKIWQKDSSHNWTVYDATPQDEMIIPWISSITALYFQLTVASSQAIRVTKMTSGLLYDVDKTDEDDTPTTLFSDGVSQPIVPIGEGPGGGATITSHAITDWASGAMQTLSVTAGSTPVVQVIEDVPTPAASSALSYTGANQTFVVPAGVTSLTAKLWGAGGASANGSDGGAGGYVTSTIPVTAGETLNITVGQGGTLGPATTFGGGGGGDTTYPQHGNAGGGLSGIFRGTAMNASQPSNALVIAGAGGSGGYSAAGGAGGGETAQDGFGSATHSGNGGTQVAGGDGGSATNGTGAAGTQFQGGSFLSGLHPGGGGGGGWFGGGCAGSSGGNHAGGGGGSSYINAAASVTGTHYAGSGITVPQTSDPDYVAGIGAPATSGHSVGNNGLVVISYSAGEGIKTLKFESDYKIDNSATDSVKVTKLSAGTANAKVKIIE